MELSDAAIYETHQLDLGQSRSFDEALAKSGECQKAIARVTRRYGVDWCQFALNEQRRELQSKPKTGRKPEIGPDELRDIWLFVEEGKARTGQSASQFCQKQKFGWLSRELDGTFIKKVLKGPTLRRRYQEAVKFLKDQSAPYERLAKMRSESSQIPANSHIEIFWRDVLRQRLSD